MEQLDKLELSRVLGQWQHQGNLNFGSWSHHFTSWQKLIVPWIGMPCPKVQEVVTSFYLKNNHQNPEVMWICSKLSWKHELYSVWNIASCLLLDFTHLNKKDKSQIIVKF